MKIEEARIIFPRAQRVYTAGSPDKPALIALHGYGQLPRFFIRKFSFLTENFHVIVPEGLHRFYLEGFSGRVGSSWMTKEDRLNDIKEQKDYLDLLLKEMDLRLEKTVLLAFSQGIATAARWLHHSEHRFEELIFWAGNFPPDLDLSEKPNFWKDQKIEYVFGKEDEFFDEERIQGLYSELKNRGLNFNSRFGSFAHDIDQAMLSKILKL